LSEGKPCRENRAEVRSALRPDVRGANVSRRSGRECVSGRIWGDEWRSEEGGQRLQPDFWGDECRSKSKEEGSLNQPVWATPPVEGWLATRQSWSNAAAHGWVSASGWRVGPAA
jgi:hypothetical protein